MKRTIDELLKTPYWIIDILPEQVPKDSPGQYFKVLDYYLREQNYAGVKQKHISLILKLNCYRDLSLDEEDTINPPPDYIANAMRERYVNVMLGESMIISEPDDTHMTVFNPDERLLDLLRVLSAGEGLFLWKP